MIVCPLQLLSTALPDPSSQSGVPVAPFRPDELTAFVVLPVTASCALTLEPDTCHVALILLAAAPGVVPFRLGFDTFEPFTDTVVPVEQPLPVIFPDPS